MTRIAKGLAIGITALACGCAAAYLTRARLEQQDQERAVVYVNSQQEHPVVKLAVESHNLAMAIDEHYLGREARRGAVESRIEQEIRVRVLRLQQSIEELLAAISSNLRSMADINASANTLGNAYFHLVKHHDDSDGYDSSTHTFICNRGEVRAGTGNLLEIYPQLEALEEFDHIELKRAAKKLRPGEGGNLTDHEARQLQQTLVNWPDCKLLIEYRYLLLANRSARDTSPLEQILSETDTYPQKFEYTNSKKPNRFPIGFDSCRSVRSTAMMLVEQYSLTTARIDILAQTSQLVIDTLDHNDTALLGDLSIKLLEDLGEETAGRRTRAQRARWVKAVGAVTSLITTLLLTLIASYRRKRAGAG